MAAKQAELTKLNVYAALLTHLRHPWPRSRVLDELTVPLPDEVSLVRIELRGVPRELVRSGEAAASADSAEQKKPSIETDLAALREQSEREEVVIALEGTTIDQSVLHIYLQSLAVSPLVATAELTQVEATPAGNQLVDSASTAAGSRSDRFTAVIKLRPGWGLPGGPQTRPEATSPEAAPAESTATKSRDAVGDGGRS
ncbi:MAG: hypothetical protein QM775_28175 [Pirellulales bacterium]